MNYAETTELAFDEIWHTDGIWFDLGDRFTLEERRRNRWQKLVYLIKQ